MNKFFDYIFYRVYKQYEKWREDYPYPFAEGVVVVIQCFLLLDIFTILSSLNFLPRKIEDHRLYVLGSLVILYIVNNRRYKKNYIEIVNDCDKTDDPNRKPKGILIVMLIVVVILFPMVIGYLRNNLGYDI